jgi:spermidine synthase
MVDVGIGDYPTSHSVSPGPSIRGQHWIRRLMITIANIETDHGQVSVLRNRKTGAIVYWQDSTYQSEADERGVSLAAYVHALYGLLRQERCRDVLLIGCGGGTLATMLSAHDTRVLVLDVNAWSFVLAKRYFALPPTIECRLGDAKEFLGSASRMFDAIVLDAYHEGRIPSHYCEASFAALARRRLNPRGLFLANVFLSHDLDDTADRLAETLQSTWPRVRLLDQRGSSCRNAIVLAGAVDELERPVLMSSPQCGAQEIADDLGNMRFRPVRQPRFGSQGPG